MTGAQWVGDFRPISLINGVSKVLACRLKKKSLHWLILLNPHSFMDVPSLIAWSLPKRLYRLAPKISGQLSSSSWILPKLSTLLTGLSFLKFCKLKGLELNGVDGFFHYLAQASLQCLLMVILDLLSNDKRWLWQGDPLSPYLFILGVYVLSRILNLAYEGDIVQKVKPWNLGFLCLQYVDDTIMLLSPYFIWIKRLKILLYIFWASLETLQLS